MHNHTYLWKLITILTDDSGSFFCISPFDEEDFTSLFTMSLTKFLPDVLVGLDGTEFNTSFVVGEESELLSDVFAYHNNNTITFFSFTFGIEVNALSVSKLNTHITC